MKATFVAVAGGVGYVVTKLLPELPGLVGAMTLTGTVAAVVGAMIAIRISRNKNMRTYILTGIICIVIFIVGLTLYLQVVHGEPGPAAANWAYVWTAIMFVPIGIAVELLGIEFTED